MEMLLNFQDMVRTSLITPQNTTHTLISGPFLKKIVVDPYPPVKEKAMDALLIFMSKFTYQSVVPPKYALQPSNTASTSPPHHYLYI